MQEDWFEMLACHLSEHSSQMASQTHRHRDPQWYLCVDGAFAIEMNDEIIRCSPGAYILVPPWATRNVIEGERCTYLMLRFRSSCIDHDRWSRVVARLPDDCAEDLRCLLNTLSQSNEDARKNPLIEVILLRLLLAAQESAIQHQRAAVADRQNAEDVVAKALAYMAGNYAQECTREDIAAACHCSPVHLARLCRDRRGATPLQLLTDIRMRHARQLLQSDRRSIGAIAGLVGYATASHFAFVFKRFHGLSARDFRRGGGRMWWQRKPVDEGPIIDET